jgi:hypothetical protein
MRQPIAFCLFILIGLMVNAQTAINLRGTVSNKAGKPIANAIVTLVKQAKSDTTGADGAYSILNGTGVQLPLLLPKNQFISMSNGFVIFSLTTPSPVKVDIFDIKGNLLKSELKQNTAAGFYRFKIAENSRTRASKLLIIKASIGQEQVTLRYLPVNNGNNPAGNVRESGLRAGKNSFVKLAAVNDTLRTAAPNYKTQITAVTSYDQLVNITLDTAGGSAQPSAGCGKEPPFSGEKRVTINVTAAGTGNRDYILRLPGDYDKNHPYPLLFAVHCMSGSADNVAHSESDTREQYEYLGLWKFANPAGGKGTTIFCAPEGISAAWGQGQKDLEFFRAMIRKFEAELCIDQSRIFSIGFSMGGSMSYALACAMPDTMRAIGMLSGGSMSNCTGTRGPVPIFITHGTQDGRCTWPGSGYPQIKDLAARDGCDAIDIPTLVSQNPPADQMHPVCFEYKNCKPGFPCRACIFKGDHIGSPGTQGSYGKNNTWTDDSAWSYFKRFY